MIIFVPYHEKAKYQNPNIQNHTAMTSRLSKKQLNNLGAIGLLVSVIGIVVLLFPNENKFVYQFEIGKPWTYELMTASYDFPIYKSKTQIIKEREEVLTDYSPFFQADTSRVKTQLDKLLNDCQKNNGISTANFNFISKKLNYIYSKGIISVDDYNRLIKDKRQNISCIYPNRVTRLTTIKEIYTPRTAYEVLLKNAPDVLKSYNLNGYLVENLRYDSATSEISKAELLKGLSQTSGMIQTGEKIIDKGEKVSPTTFAILKSLKIEFEKRNTYTEQTFLVKIGEIILAFGLIGLFFLYVLLFRPRIFKNFSSLFFLCLLIVMLVAITSFVIHYGLDYYMIPFVLLPIITRVFFDPRTALFIHITTMMIISFMVANSFQFLILQITAGMVAVSSLKDMTQRSQLAQSALYIFLVYAAMYLSFEFVSEGDIHRVEWTPLRSFAVSSFMILFAYVLIYIFEKIFGLISAITLLELNNINSDLMLRFAEVAPGTFQHSLQVSNLATEAAKKINANSLLVRTGALYHDIGKMMHPELFIENQVSGKNPLMEMDFETASRMVIRHVADGIAIAKRNHLPDQIISFIATHHGISKTKYFYNSFINSNPGSEPNEEAFTYPGPRPYTKETAIVMMADAVEACSRSLKVYTIENLNLVVENMIDTQITEGEFKDAPITFRDVEIVKAVFKERLKNVYHNRIVYPKLSN
jgi:cyclic-di-AMP phosphodiesterase PgpH